MITLSNDRMRGTQDCILKVYMMIILPMGDPIFTKTHAYVSFKWQIHLLVSTVEIRTTFLEPMLSKFHSGQYSHASWQWNINRLDSFTISSEEYGFLYSVSLKSIETKFISFQTPVLVNQTGLKHWYLLWLMLTRAPGNRSSQRIYVYIYIHIQIHAYIGTPPGTMHGVTIRWTGKQPSSETWCSMFLVLFQLCWSILMHIQPPRDLLPIQIMQIKWHVCMYIYIYICSY
jgi:hypothetical protein